MKHLKKFEDVNVNEAKIEVEFDNSNLILTGYGHDTNGNHIVKLSFPNQRAFSIQTDGVMKTANRILRSGSIKDIKDKDLKAIEKEAIKYLKDHGTAVQKKTLKIYESEMNESSSNTNEINMKHIKMFEPFLNESQNKIKIPKISYTAIDKKSYETSQTGIEFSIQINGKTAKGFWTPSHGRYVNDGVDINDLKDQNNKRFNIFDGGGNRRTYEISAHLKPSEKQPKNLQFTGRTLSIDNLKTVFVDKIKKAFENPEQEPKLSKDFLDYFGISKFNEGAVNESYPEPDKTECEIAKKLYSTLTTGDEVAMHMIQHGTADLDENNITFSYAGKEYMIVVKEVNPS